MGAPLLRSVGLHVAANDAYGGWIREIFGQIGLATTEFPTLNDDLLRTVSVLVLLGDGRCTESEKALLERWTARGGHLVICGTPWELYELVGVTGGRLRRVQSEPITFVRSAPFAGLERLFCLSGWATQTTDAEVRATTEGGDAIWTQNGTVTYLGLHPGRSLALFGLGAPVESDGIGPYEPGTDLQDGVLRAEDGIRLDFDEHREGANPAAFLSAWVDRERSLLAHVVLTAIARSQTVTPLFWPWPRAARGAMIVSFDASATSGPEILNKQALFLRYGIRPTWLNEAPGMAGEIYRGLHRMDHEAGALISALPHLSDDQTKMQCHAMARTAALPIQAARPPRGQFFGQHVYYARAEHAGVRLSLAKGGHQPGTTGFCFGTAMPFLPQSIQGRPFRVFEAPYVAYRPGAVTPSALLKEFAEECSTQHTVFHVADDWNPREVDRFGEAFQELMALSRRYELVRMRAGEILQREEARRTLRWKLVDEHLVIASNEEVEGFTVLLAGLPVSATTPKAKLANYELTRYGVDLSGFSFDLEEKRLFEVNIAPLEERAITPQAA